MVNSPLDEHRRPADQTSRFNSEADRRGRCPIGCQRDASPRVCDGSEMEPKPPVVDRFGSGGGCLAQRALIAASSTTTAKNQPVSFLMVWMMDKIKKRPERRLFTECLAERVSV